MYEQAERHAGVDKLVRCLSAEGLFNTFSIVCEAYVDHVDGKKTIVSGTKLNSASREQDEGITVSPKRKKGFAG